MPSIGPELRRQHEIGVAARNRLWGRPGARPGANMPRNGTAQFRRTERPAVDFVYAMRLVCEDQQVTPDQILNSTYSAAVAARHMLWTVMLDGGHPVANIARIFGVDHATVTIGIRSFRDFQKGQV
ncbi:hypothetical protein VW35_00910 [Devosia soli]|uniref:Chromosomal replication initiator protein DnaA n=2 Tax=Devosia soli TaxID=361041 RepID=A0A0F5LEI5_9HYPH|nr:hypothetical protein VW35_00910 [Devosia soli]